MVRPTWLNEFLLVHKRKILRVRDWVWVALDHISVRFP
ncbi:hypothetical protein RGAI101_3474 [Roseobacter sp. GAI101]|nr:hypothetical protein RGAI101_3474 [Roseobacter sp. GAI101]